MNSRTDWVLGPEAWKQFAHRHPELGYKPDRMAFYNFLRYYKDHLVRADALRRAKRRFWVAHPDRFCEEAFACATGCRSTGEVV